MRHDFDYNSIMRKESAGLALGSPPRTEKPCLRCGETILATSIQKYCAPCRKARIVRQMAAANQRRKAERARKPDAI